MNVCVCVCAFECVRVYVCIGININVCVHVNSEVDVYFPLLTYAYFSAYMRDGIHLSAFVSIKKFSMKKDVNKIKIR